MPSQLAYGERILNGRVVPHLGEQQILDELDALRKDGISFGRLAQWLNKRSVPTKNRKGQSDRRTVWEILRRRDEVNV